MIFFDGLLKDRLRLGTCFASCVALLSPLFQPYLLNPNIIPFYSIPFFFTLWLIAVVVNQKSNINITPLTVGLFLMVLLLSIPLTNTFAFIVVSSFIVFIVFSQRQYCSIIDQPLLISIALFTSLALLVWMGFTHGNALHLGLWALTSDAGIKPNGSFVNGNVLAIFNACAWLIATVYALKTKHWRWWLFSFFFLCCVSISMAWGAWLALIPVIIWLFIYCTVRKNYRALFALLFSIILAWSIGQAVVQYVISHDSIGTETRMKNIPEHGIGERKLIWMASYKMWQEHPWFGVGLGQISAHYLTYQSKILTASKTPLPEQITLNSAHNILLQLMAEAGVFGLLLWLSITIWLFVLSWRYRMRITTSRVWPALACTWLLWIQGMGNITMSRPYPMLMFALFLAIASAPSFRASVQKKIVVKKHAVLLLLLAFIPYLAWASVQKTQAWLDYETLLYSTTSMQEQSRLTQDLVNEPSILPHLISSMVGNRLLQPELRQSTLALEPYLQQALALRQDPRLLQQQFYMHVLNKRWKKSCAIATILLPMKAEQDNRQAYIEACNKKTPKEFSFH